MMREDVIFTFGEKLNATERLMTYTCRGCSKVITTNSGFLEFEHVGKIIRAGLCLVCNGYI